MSLRRCLLTTVTGLDDNLYQGHEAKSRLQPSLLFLSVVDAFLLRIVPLWRRIIARRPVQLERQPRRTLGHRFVTQGLAKLHTMVLQTWRCGDFSQRRASRSLRGSSFAIPSFPAVVLSALAPAGDPAHR
jgi:hypothetical protein